MRFRLSKRQQSLHVHRVCWSLSLESPVAHSGLAATMKRASVEVVSASRQGHRGGACLKNWPCEEPALEVRAISSPSYRKTFHGNAAFIGASRGILVRSHVDIANTKSEPAQHSRHSSQRPGVSSRCAVPNPTHLARLASIRILDITDRRVAKAERSRLFVRRLSS